MGSRHWSRWVAGPIFSAQMGVTGLIPKMWNSFSLILLGEFNGQFHFSKKKSIFLSFKHNCLIYVSLNVINVPFLGCYNFIFWTFSACGENIQIDQNSFLFNQNKIHSESQVKYYDQICCNSTPKKINETKFCILRIRPATPICVLKVGSATHLTSCELQIQIAWVACQTPNLIYMFPFLFYCDCFVVHSLAKLIEIHKNIFQFCLSESSEFCDQVTGTISCTKLQGCLHGTCMQVLSLNFELIPVVCWFLCHVESISNPPPSCLVTITYDVMVRICQLWAEGILGGFEDRLGGEWQREWLIFQGGKRKDWTAEDIWLTFQALTSTNQ
ncbi:hypothetical protein VP01_2839g1 [Puccinia sorghi]|uniref:Uncharacterized protein n=1 Tax=Puccinia sorghi TaxID=27349 RepID=A0A0L6V3Z6_9BASI|nr:hypothetical protein VP01_2839g1 [Puccinia sorghi]